MLQIHDIIPGERDGVQFPCIWYLEQSPSTAKKFILLYVYIYTHMYMYKKKQNVVEISFQALDTPSRDLNFRLFY